MLKIEFNIWCCNCFCFTHMFKCTPKHKKERKSVFLFYLILNPQHSLAPLPLIRNTTPPTCSPTPTHFSSPHSSIILSSFFFLFICCCRLSILQPRLTPFLPPFPHLCTTFHGSLPCSSFSSFQLCSKAAFVPAKVHLFGPEDLL